MNRATGTNWNSWVDALCLRPIFFVVLSFAVIIAQTFPSMAMAGSDNGLGWVEICSDGGTYLARVGSEDGDAPDPECTHCTACIVPGNDVPGLQMSTTQLLQVITLTELSFRIGLANPAVGPEQFWSLSRGPPIANTMVYMVSNPPGRVFNSFEISSVRPIWV